MQAEVLETMNLIVDVGTADEGAAVSYLAHLVEHSQRVLGGIALVGISPVSVIVGSSGGPLEITAKVAEGLTQIGTHHRLMIGRSEAVWALGGVHAGGSTYGTTVGIARLGIHTLGIQVQVQMVVQQRRTQVQGCSDTLEV